MLKALVWKEFRELLPMCVIASAIEILLISNAINSSRWGRPQDVYGVWPLLYIIVIVFSIGVGLWQNSREQSQNTILFLLHRPVRRTTIFGLKILFGASVWLLVGLLPLVCFTAWAATLVQAGLRDQMLRMFWGVCAGGWLLYLGAFLTSLRAAKWYASRFYPLLAGIFLFVLIQIFFVQLGRVSETWAMASLAFGPLVSIGFVIAALYVGQTQDYS